VEGADDALDVDQYDEFGRSVLRAGDAVDTSEPPKQQTGMGASAEMSNINGKKRPRVWDRDRSAADYMDDRDYEDWGGPTGVSAEYADPNALSISRSARKKSDVNDESGSGQQKGLGLLVPTELLQPVAGPTDAIGRLLLRKLGWREGSGTDAKSSAYVPTHDSGENIDTSNESTACSHEALLSKRRLKKIQLSERGHSLPPPKIDSYGLGYNPFRNAPEFAAHREMRRKRAEEKARAAGAGGGQGRYHTSDLLDDDDTGGDDVVDAFSSKKGSERSRNKSNVLAYETAEDFVGRTGTAGFALEDDDDDVYDSTCTHVASSAGISAADGGSGRSKIVGIGGEEYHTELIDHDSDAEGEGSSQVPHGGSGAFAGALSSWATGRETSAAGDPSTATRAVTSDGRLPLDGYVLGGSGGEQDITNKRFQGPDLPPNFEPVRHVFREEDLPARVAEQSRKTKREAEEARSSKAVGGASLHDPINPPRREDVTPMAGAAFAGLAVAMKNRFTSAADKKGTEKTDDNIGLRTPSAIGGDALEAQSSNTEEKKDIDVRRSTILWAPDPLLCKRLGVRPPSRTTTPVSNQQKQTEETYFHKEILRTAGASATTNTSGSNGSRAVNANDGENNDVPIRPPPGGDIGASRPPMDLFRSIFGAQSSDSEDSSSSDEEGVNGETKSALIGSVEEAAVEKDPSTASGGVNGEKNDSIASITHKDIDTGRSTDYITEKEKPHKHRRRRRSASLTSASSLSSTSSSSSYERRKRKKKSKRRKKESSSRRREDDRKRSKDERRRKKRRNRSRSRSRSRDRERDIDRKTSKKSSSRSKGGQDA
jgi:hypothetical protein